MKNFTGSGSNVVKSIEVQRANRQKNANCSGNLRAVLMTECSVGVRLVFDRNISIAESSEKAETGKKCVLEDHFQPPFFVLNKEVVSTFDVMLYHLKHFCHKRTAGILTNAVCNEKTEQKQVS